jgi:HD-GYP domain-containing protein (c-di-GMP phosphodiesterase class II)
VNEAAPLNLKRYLPHALVATALVAVAPALAVWAIQGTGHLQSPLLSALLAILLSLVAASAGSAYWKRRRRSKDLVFGDLMLWGWIRRLRTERRLADATGLLGLGGRAGGRTPAEFSPERQAEVLRELASALEARDRYTHGHSRRVTRHSGMIAKRMGLSREEVAQVQVAAAVHDVGKIHVPRDILNKPDKLTDPEFEVMKRHPVDGAEMVSRMGDSQLTAIVRHHHESWSGSGYPDRLAAGEIPLGARIIAVADTFDAITSSRPYRPACQHRKATEVLRREAGRQLDPDAVRAFLSYYSGRRSVAWWAFLTAGPQRLLSWVGGAIEGAGAAPLAKGAAVVGTTAVLGGSLVAPSAPKAGPDGHSSRAGSTDAAQTADDGLARPPKARDESTPPGSVTRPDTGREVERRSTSRDRSGTAPVSGSKPEDGEPTSDSAPAPERDSQSEVESSEPDSPESDSPESELEVPEPAPDDSGSGSDSGSGNSGSDSGDSGSGNSGSGSDSVNSGPGSTNSGPGSGSGSSGSSGSGSSGSGSSGSGSD